MAAKKIDPIGEFKSAPRYNENPPHARVFRFLTPKSATSVPAKFITYRPPRIVKGKRWYIEYWYRVPHEISNGKEWERFRVFENINRHKDDEYAKKLRDAVEDALLGGFNPFEEKAMHIRMEAPLPGPLNIAEALTLYLTSIKGKGLEKETVRKYSTATEMIRAYFAAHKLLSQPIEKVTRHHIEKILQNNKEERGWGNRQYNNIKSTFYTVFEYLKKKEVISKNPVENIESLKHSSQKHKYFDSILFPKVTMAMKTNEPYLWYAFQFVYYLAVRSEKELMGIKVSDIMEGGDYFRFRKEVSKSKREDVIPVDPNLKELFGEMGLLNSGPDYFIFSTSGHPDKKPFGKNFMSRKFQKIRKLTGLSSDYTLYSAKHTRAVHLAKDGVKVSDIMVLFRHTNIGATVKYLRDLAVDFDPTEMQSKSRKI